ncbi:MAG: hypothetical protein M1824_000406 [Vezdaea acicularis]|nr:MAG: hypothetical protein M1824_000406 [Vezdaea acicularis]
MSAAGYYQGGQGPQPPPQAYGGGQQYGGPPYGAPQYGAPQYGAQPYGAPQNNLLILGFMKMQYQQGPPQQVKQRRGNNGCLATM